jgi:hypothetical protein
MPAGSERSAGSWSGAPRPPRFRPLGVRLAVAALGVALVAVCAAIWFSFPPDVRARFDVFQRLTLLGIGLAFAAGGYALARCRVDVVPDGLVVVNGFRSRSYAWGEVAGVTLRPGAPWAVLRLADGSTAAAMGIQGSDGARATRQVEQLRSLLAEHAQPPTRPQD